MNAPIRARLAAATASTSPLAELVAAIPGLPACRELRTVEERLGELQSKRGSFTEARERVRREFGGTTAPAAQARASAADIASKLKAAMRDLVLGRSDRAQIRAIEEERRTAEAAAQRTAADASDDAALLELALDEIAAQEAPLNDEATELGHHREVLKRAAARQFAELAATTYRERALEMSEALMALCVVADLLHQAEDVDGPRRAERQASGAYAFGRFQGYPEVALPTFGALKAFALPHKSLGWSVVFPSPPSTAIDEPFVIDGERIRNDLFAALQRHGINL